MFSAIPRNTLAYILARSANILIGMFPKIVSARTCYCFLATANSCLSVVIVACRPIPYPTLSRTGARISQSLGNYLRVRALVVCCVLPSVVELCGVIVCTNTASLKGAQTPTIFLLLY